MNPRTIILLGLLVVIAAIILVLVSSASPDKAIASKFCDKAHPFGQVMRCQGVYRVTPILPDLPTRYVAPNRTVIASCGGFINLPQPEQCGEFIDMNCSDNLCK